MMDHLTVESTLVDLKLYDTRAELSQLGKVLAQIFENDGNIPGVILGDRGEFVGMISQRQFWRLLSRPYGRELFLTRPIQSLYRFLRVQPLVLPAHTTISDAARQAVKRPPEHLYEPLVVRLSPSEFRVLDTQQLLVAQLFVHQLAIQLLENTEHLLKEANLELHRMVRIDQLTQISNRRKFDEFIEAEWRRHFRLQFPLSIIIADVDYFKAYNDYYGHQAGDDCLKTVAQLIDRAVRQSSDLVARYGGEEFAVILPETSPDTAEAIGERIRATVEQHQLPHVKSKVCPYITLSLGISSQIPTYSTSFETLIATADAALYRAKEWGRNRIVSLCGEKI
ncbi:MAG: GGDEF domain-containing protein [Limnospira sp.]